ncbi:MAG TPA: hypothetical protein VD929_01480 [Caulobacteraceae bacterium]|nr:hypothetical protein [Caulobacteraceae bacterium]
MKQTVTRLFDSHDEAERAIQSLERAGVPHEDISLVGGDHHRHQESRSFAGKDGDGDGENDAAEGAGKGAATGGLLGGGAGLLAGLGMLAIPGLGPVVAAGWLASTAAGAAAGALAGGAAGGLLGALKDSGHSDEDAQVYAEGVRRGGTLVSVRVDEGRRMEVEQLLNQSSGVDAATRGQAYRNTGWGGYDEAAPRFSREDMERERGLYR